MVGIASRYFAGRIALAVAAATVIGLATGTDGTGHVVMYATIVLATAAVSFTLMASLSLAVGDSDSDDRQHAHTHPTLPAYWPVMGALGMGLVMVGLVIDAIFTIAGVGLLVVAAVEWTMAAWSERLSTDTASNETQRSRLVRPFEISLFGTLAIAIPVLLVSRVFLAASRNGASWIAIGVSATILLFAVLLGFELLRRRVVATLLFLAAVGLIVVGIAAAAIGEREFHPHTEAEEAESSEEGGES